MINKNLLIIIGVLVVAGLGLLFMSTMTGNVITGSAAVEKVDDEEYFRISDFGNDINEEVKSDEDNSGSG